MRDGRTSFSLLGIGLLVVALGCATRAQTGSGPYGIGATASPPEVAALDIDVAIDGSGLPHARGTAVDGAPIYAASCSRCHGERISLRRWSHPTALFDYIRRAMPPEGPRPLPADDLYAVTAYLYYADGRLGAHDIVSWETLPTLHSLR